jgi:hypothetical protein
MVSEVMHGVGRNISWYPPLRLTLYLMSGFIRINRQLNPIFIQAAGSSVDIVTRLLAGWPRNRGSVTSWRSQELFSRNIRQHNATRIRDFSLKRLEQPTSMSTLYLPTSLKKGRSAKLTTRLHLAPSLRKTARRFYHMSSWPTEGPNAFSVIFVHPAQYTYLECLWVLVCHSKLSLTR